ncbi:MAG: MarR family transcriptional regulator [Proteobacteria bacterium]|nr:MAG: MarR family transcriptional regulator [Pseudomonadota bacterium]
MGMTPYIDSDGSIRSKSGQKLDPRDYDVLVVPKKKKQPKKLKEEDWLMFYQAGLAILAKDKEVRGAPRSVLDMMMSMMDFENFIGIDQTYIAKELSMEKSSVSRAIKILVDKEILIKGPKYSRMNSYNLNPTFAWRGTVESKFEKYPEKVIDLDKARKKRAKKK